MTNKPAAPGWVPITKNQKKGDSSCDQKTDVPNCGTHPGAAGKKNKKGD